MESNVIKITQRPDGNFEVAGPGINLISERPNFVSELIRCKLLSMERDAKEIALERDAAAWEENLTSTAKAALTRLRALKIKPEFERDAIELLNDETPNGLAHVVAIRGLADVIEDLPKSVASNWFEPSDDQMAGWARQALVRLRELMIKPEHEHEAIQVLSGVPLREHLDWIENARQEHREWFQRGERVIESLTPPNALSGGKFSAGSILIRLQTMGIKPEFKLDALNLVQLSGPDKTDELLRELPMSIHPEWFDQNAPPAPPVRIETPRTIVPEVGPEPEPLPIPRLNALTLQKNEEGDFVFTGPNHYSVVPVAEAMKGDTLFEQFMGIVAQLTSEPRDEKVEFTPIPTRLENQGREIVSLRALAERMSPIISALEIAGHDSKTHFVPPEGPFWKDLLPESEVPTPERPLVVEFGHGRILIGTFRRKSTGAAGVYFKEVDQAFKIGELPRDARKKDRGFIYFQFSNDDSILALIDMLQFVRRRHPLPKSTNVVQHYAADLTFTERKRAEALALEWLSTRTLEPTPFNIVTALSQIGHFASDEEDVTLRELRELWRQAKYGSRSENRGGGRMERTIILHAEPAEKIAAILGPHSPTFAEEADRQLPFAGFPGRDEPQECSERCKAYRRVIEQLRTLWDTHDRHPTMVSLGIGAATQIASLLSSPPIFEEPQDEPRPYDVDEIIKFVTEKIGEASMCWNPIPTGVFNSTEAMRVSREIVAKFLSETNLFRARIESLERCEAGWKLAMEEAARDVAAAREETQKFRTASSVLCGAHIGKMVDQCPICAVIASTQPAVEEALTKIEGPDASALQMRSAAYRIELLGKRLAEAEKEATAEKERRTKYGGQFGRMREFVIGEGPTEMFRWSDALKKAERRVAETLIYYLGSLWNEMRKTQAELRRFQSGDLTPDELQTLCHNMAGKVDADAFCDGCEAYQIQLFGRSPTKERREKLAEEAGQLRTALRHWHTFIETLGAKLGCDPTDSVVLRAVEELIGANPGAVPGVIFGLSNDGGKTAIRWRWNVIELLRFKEAKGNEALRDYAVVAVGRVGTDRSSTPEPHVRCSVCDWTNVGLLNLGEHNAAEWVCHGCIKREHDAAKQALGTLKYLIDFAEQGWVIIANANGGNWEQANADWRTAAERYRDDFHERVRFLLPLEDPLRSYRKPAMDVFRGLMGEQWSPKINAIAKEALSKYGETF